MTVQLDHSSPVFVTAAGTGTLILCTPTVCGFRRSATCQLGGVSRHRRHEAARGILWTWAVALHGIEKVERYPSPIISASPYPSNFRRPKPRNGLLGRTGGGEASGRSSSPLRGICSVVLDDTPSCPSNWPDLHMEPSSSTIARPITAKGWRQSQSAFEHFPHWPRLHA